jgi:hypothetical protein
MIRMTWAGQAFWALFGASDWALVWARVRVGKATPASTVDRTIKAFNKVRCVICVPGGGWGR